MIHKLIFFFTICMLIGISFLFYQTILPIFLAPPKESYLSYNEVAGIAFVKENKEYLLNFNQQNLFLTYLNELKSNQNPFEENLDFEKVIIYRFNEKNLIIDKGNIFKTLCSNNF